MPRKIKNKILEVTLNNGCAVLTIMLVACSAICLTFGLWLGTRRGYHHETIIFNGALERGYIIVEDNDWRWAFPEEVALEIMEEYMPEVMDDWEDWVESNK